MVRRFWLLFAQACTLCLAALFVVVTLRPDLLPQGSGHTGTVVVTQETATPVTAARVASYADAAKKAMPAVVNLYTSKEVRARNPLAEDPLFRRYFPELDRGTGRRQTSLGSGVIVSPEGYVLTNHHVIEGADDIQLVLSDGRRISARVRGTDPESDLAVLKADVEGLPAMTFASTENLQVGDVVLAIGNPFGLGNTVTFGIVSAMGRNYLGVNRFEDFIQTDAAINPGNSGGALVDTAGNLVGINSTIYSQSGGSLGIAFSIPVSLARSVFEQIVRDGEVTRGWLGIVPAPVTAEAAKALALERAEGVVIRELEPNGPAARAGMQVYDVVVEIAGKPTRNVPQLLARIAELPPGSVAKVNVVRKGKEALVDVTVGKRPPPEKQ
ncbi:MAG: trypsin-like peptidase domain-containing protein [Betaproteobacteria bacterium]|nr:trypsin-like peptidase domain-containing protein [Betaproteobacteria bacterium]MCC7215767.1 trypsin-like peptidase domain-containing protein [Burkholderiales bacterium]